MRGGALTPQQRSADYRTLNFVLASNVIVFFYSFWMMVADAVRMSGRYARRCARRLSACPPHAPSAPQVEEL